MKKSNLIVATFGTITLINGALALPIQASASLVVAIQNDSGINFGTDSDTTSTPKGLNTMPTKEVGTELNAVNQNAPMAKPDEAPAFAPPPAFAPAPAYKPPVNQGGTLNKHPSQK